MKKLSEQLAREVVDKDKAVSLMMQEKQRYAQLQKQWQVKTIVKPAKVVNIHGRENPLKSMSMTELWPNAVIISYLGIERGLELWCLNRACSKYFARRHTDLYSLASQSYCILKSEVADMTKWLDHAELEVKTF